MSDWAEHVDDDTGYFYYHNAKTGMTQWDKPLDLYRAPPALVPATHYRLDITPLIVFSCSRSPAAEANPLATATITAAVESPINPPPSTGAALATVGTGSASGDATAAPATVAAARPPPTKPAQHARVVAAQNANSAANASVQAAVAKIDGHNYVRGSTCTLMT